MILAPLVDRIYEAAFVPDLWEDALAAVAAASGSAAASLVIYRSLDAPPLFRATPRTHEALAGFVSSGAWRTCGRMRAARRAPWRGFVYASDLAPPGAAADDVSPALRAIGLDAQLNGLVLTPSGETCGLTMERDLGAGLHTPEERTLLDSLMPHFSRALLIAARLGLEAARSAAHAFALLGLPAAAVLRSGHALAANEPFERRHDLFVWRANGRLALRDRAADALLQSALAEFVVADAPTPPRSIPLRAAGRRAPTVVHVLPARRAARDVLSGADALVVVTEVRQGSGASPSPPILGALFDLSPAEARLCVELARTLSLAEATKTLGVTPKTGRTYLDRIFLKTGAHSQAELLALLRQTAPPSAG